MIEFCREKIIMTNNPECKTYEEALEKEYQSGDCYVGKNNLDVVLSKDVFLAIKAYKDGTITYDYILGLPLTLERVLVALNSNGNNTKFISNGLQVNRVDWYSTGVSIGSNLLNWKSNITLECQSDKTIEAIYEIFKDW